LDILQCINQRTTWWASGETLVSMNMQVFPEYYDSLHSPRENMVTWTSFLVTPLLVSGLYKGYFGILGALGARICLFGEIVFSRS
jgi:hypothetical protein